MYRLFDFNRKVIEKNRKATHNFPPRPLIFKLQQEVLKVNDIIVSCSSPKLTW